MHPLPQTTFAECALTGKDNRFLWFKLKLRVLHAVLFVAYGADIRICGFSRFQELVDGGLAICFGFDLVDGSMSCVAAAGICGFFVGGEPTSCSAGHSWISGSGKGFGQPQVVQRLVVLEAKTNFGRELIWRS